MIRVNLARNRTGEHSATKATMASTVAQTSESRGNFLKLVLIFIFVIGLVFLENQGLNQLRITAAQLGQQATELEGEATAKAKEVESIKDIEAQARELEDKLKILKLLSRLRLREVKTLDFMQSSIPEKVWLSSLSFEGDKERFEEGRFNFAGHASNSDELTEFVKRLEDSGYMQEVIIVKNQEASNTNNPKAVTREFTFSALVENHP